MCGFVLDCCCCCCDCCFTDVGGGLGGFGFGFAFSCFDAWSDRFVSSIFRTFSTSSKYKSLNRR